MRLGKNGPFVDCLRREREREREPDTTESVCECVCVTKERVGGCDRERETERVCGSKEKFRNQLSKDESVKKSCKTKIKIHELFFSKRPE